MARYQGKRVLPPPPWKRPLLFLLTAALLVFVGLMGRDICQARRERAAYQELARKVHDAERLSPAPWAAPEGSLPAEIFPEGAPGEEAAPALSPYEALAGENPDLAGWISIPDTPIDYPVMYTPQEPEYYLRRAFDGTKAVSGSLFIGAGCSPGGAHVIIYGHNMNDGSMFGSLARYAEKDYAAAHPVIRFDTLERTGEYRVLAAFYSHAYTSDEEGFRYYRYTDLSQPEKLAEYVQKAREAALYDTGVEADRVGRLLTLSTCSYHRKNGTFVVVAAEVEENAAPPL